MNFKEEIPLGEFPLFLRKKEENCEKKVLGLLLAVMTAAMLTACGSGKEADTAQHQKAQMQPFRRRHLQMKAQMRQKTAVQKRNFKSSDGMWLCTVQLDTGR